VHFVGVIIVWIKEVQWNWRLKKVKRVGMTAQVRTEYGKL
jgi:hypothetical protein